MRACLYCYRAHTITWQRASVQARERVSALTWLHVNLLARCTMSPWCRDDTGRHRNDAPRKCQASPEIPGSSGQEARDRGGTTASIASRPPEISSCAMEQKPSFAIHVGARRRVDGDQ